MSAAGLDAYLTKPVKHGQLCEALSKVIATEPSHLPQAHAPSPLQAAAAPCSNGMRVLIAEDNIVNQKVAVSQIRKLGCYVDVVSNGREALNALRAVEYDLVLMDCQMPEVDGYEATVQLRSMEGNGRHTPVVAMTAHAIEGDREKCMAAGMDDYLSKPVRFEDLSAVVKRIQADCGEQGPAIGAESLEALRELGIDDFGGNSDILTDLIDTFLENAAQIFAQATDALSRREPAALALAAHTLKGSCSNFGAAPLQRLCAELEGVARNPDFTGSASAESRAAQLLKAARREFERVSRALVEYRKRA
jgi:CheY-like chemotaxis protein/HPt (histidine-containing phosphotransfer) domain-containing protein